MPLLREKVICYRCGEQVDKLQSRKVPTNNDQNKYECFPCFRNVRRGQPGFGNVERLKHSYYCERCRYKFSSKVGICPYCDKDDCLEFGNVGIKDLL